MEFNIRYTSGPKVLAIIFGFILLLPLLLWLCIAFDLDKHFLIIFAPVPIIAPLVAFKVATRIAKINLKEDAIEIDGRSIPLADISSFFFRYETIAIICIDLALKNGKEMTIMGINHGKFGDQPIKLVQALKEKFEAIRLHYTESARSKKIKEYRKAWRLIIKATIGLTLSGDVILIGAAFFGHPLPIWWLICSNIGGIPLLLMYLGQFNKLDELNSKQVLE